jgi:hypothetical protein
MTTLIRTSIVAISSSSAVRQVNSVFDSLKNFSFCFSSLLPSSNEQADPLFDRLNIVFSSSQASRFSVQYFEAVLFLFQCASLSSSNEHIDPPLDRLNIGFSVSQASRFFFNCLNDSSVVLAHASLLSIDKILVHRGDSIQFAINCFRGSVIYVCWLMVLGESCKSRFSLCQIC